MRFLAPEKPNHISLGFTLIELLVSLAVVAILITIVVVSVGNIREGAYESKALSSLRQASSGIFLIVADQGDGSFVTRVGGGGGSGPTGFSLWPIQLEERFGMDREAFFCELSDTGLEPHESIFDSGTRWAFRVAWGFNQTGQIPSLPYPGDDDDTWRAEAFYFNQVSNPSDTLLLGSVMSSIGRGRHSIDGIDFGSGDHSGVPHLRYRNRAAVAFLDGSVRMLNPQELANIGFLGAFGATLGQRVTLPSPQS